MRTKKRTSLKTRTIVLALLCWILPLSLILLMGCGYISNNLNARIDESFASARKSDAMLIMSKLDRIIYDSKGASGDKVIDEAYQAYAESGAAQADRETELKDKVLPYLNSKYSYNASINYAALCFFDRPEAYYATDETIEDLTDYYKAHHEAIRIAPELNDRVEFFYDGGKVYLICALTLDGAENSPYCALILNLNSEELFKNIFESPWKNSSVLAINNMAISFSGEGNSDEISLLGSDADYEKIFRKDDKVVFRGKIDANDYTYEYSVAEETKYLYKDSIELRNAFLWAAFVFFVVVSSALFYFYYSSNKTLGYLLNSANEIEQGNFGYEIEDNTSIKEFSYLIQSFNSMSRQLKLLFDKYYMEQLALKDAKIMALQAQINPHFLNNTLELMNWQARMNGAEEVSGMIEALSTMLDSSLNRSGKKLITLKEELEVADAYLYIINHRYGKRLIVIKEIDQTLLDCQTPPMILQPLLENAVSHGIEPRLKGVIYLRVFSEGSNLAIEIENDGVPLAKEDEERIDKIIHPDKDANKMKKTSSLGLKNVYDRLKLIYSKDSDLNIFSGENGNTVAKITVPINQTAQE